MCSIVVVRGTWADTPLLICANRDEQLDRPSEGLRRRTFGERQCISPKDLQAGGTWLGTNDQHLFVGITNRFSGPPDKRRLSRGKLVLSALQAQSASHATELIQTHPATHYNPCHLIFTSTEETIALVNNGNSWERHDIEHAVTIVTERSYNAAPTTRDALLQRGVSSWLHRDRAPTNPEIVQLMSSHASPTFEGACVHWDDRNYGTRTLAVVRVAPSGTFTHFSTDGPPCSSPLIAFEQTA